MVTIKGTSSPPKSTEKRGNKEDETARFLQEVNSIRRYLLSRLDQKWRDVDERYGMHDRLRVARAWAGQHRLISIFLLATFVLCALPLICFLTSLAGICFLAVTAVLLVQGTLLTIGVVILGGILLFGAFLSFSFTSCIIVGFIAVQYGSKWSKRFRNLSAYAQGISLRDSVDSHPKDKTHCRSPSDQSTQSHD